MILADIHTHTAYGHGNSSVREMFEAGQKYGLRVHGFSEHSPRPAGYDYEQEYRDKLESAFPAYIKEVQDLAEEQKKNGVTVLLGMELDWLEREIPYQEKLVAAYPFDYVIGGIHFLGKWGFDAMSLEWEVLYKEEQEEFYVRYYETMILMAQSGLFQVAAHPDLIKIFTRDHFHEWLPQNMNLVEHALRAIKNAGMVMEISSAGLRKPCAEIYPCPEIMGIARDLKLPVSFGSDGHCVNTITKDFDTLANYAQSFGYTESYYFKEKQPYSIKF